VSDLLPTLNGEGSPRVVHGFVVYHLHLHRFIAGRSYLHCSIRPAVDHKRGLRSITHPSPWRASIHGSLGTRGYVEPLLGIPLWGHVLFYNTLKYLEFKKLYPTPGRGRGLPFFCHVECENYHD